uniref:Uncharacterized protein n=1 Tax=Arundo donax TaxID=35708 RepID=A0A0A9CNG2_ARUDO
MRSELVIVQEPA